MLLSPKKTKYRKSMRRVARQIKHESKNKRKTISFGDTGFVATNGFWMTQRQIESIRITVVRMIKKIPNYGMYWRVFPDKPITKRSEGSTLGSGKGDVEYWVATVRPNSIFLETKNVSGEILKKILRNINIRLPVKISVMYKK